MKQFLQRKLSGVLVIGETQSLFPEQGCSHLSNDQDHLQTLIKQRARSYPQSFWFSRWGCVQTLHFFPFLKKTYFIIHFCLCWAFIAARGLSLAVASGATLHCRVRASHCGSFSCCGAWVPRLLSPVPVAHGSVAVSHGLWIRGFGTYSMWTQ